MPNLPASTPKKDLATRVFNNFYFDIAWILFLAVVVKLVQPLSDALLVFWVYGKAAYFQQGIRVIKHKPTTFSNGARSPDFPDIVTGFAIFFITVFGLSLLLIYGLRLYEKYFSRQTPKGP
jgi:hypothetical protein